ncbi:MAG: HRDC domain-containing protein [Anaerolineae bacterium]|uniref:ribonuclease D n=1 Tax=Promineifilum sp. TaxID=2664178 RepID=UPI001D1B14F1|nr:HRDC domain-containing protein [Anaerolineales bacterium]MCB8934117.1 HRDC domain-containing protein [Promineifilum sp.]MCO5179739.1 HRDC domain-containing protein [Promineifilum sp.]MCW5845701.1 HRDC domain-containing protein [Anaerolineae bacterium]
MTPDNPDRSGALPPFQYVDTPAGWADCSRALQEAPRLAIDLEANSMFAYQERACLMQISTADADYIVDPVSGIQLDALGKIIADPAVEKVFHAAEYDLILMRRDFGWHLNNLFDTMWAVRILGYSQMGLANLLEKFYGVSTSKRFQKANWCKRPLSTAELAYAQKDTHYLLPLRDQLAAQLEAGGHTDEAHEIFREQAQVRLPDTAFDPDGFWHINGAFDLSSEQQAVLRGLYLFRDREAERRDVPPFKVVGERTLLELATRLPARMSELDDVHGMSAGQQRRYGHRFLQVIGESRRLPAPQPPKRTKRPPDDVLNRYDRLHHWRKARAKARGVESDVIVSRDALWAVAQAAPRSLDELKALEVLGPWRFATYGAEMLRLV